MIYDYNQIYQLPIMDVIRKRISVRTYQSKEIPTDLKEQLLTYGARINGPFQPKVRLEFIDNASIAEKAGGKIGTYGLIKGAQHYIAAIVEKGDKNFEQLGYIFEKFILYATSLDLGTCWMGGTFRRRDFAKILPLRMNEEMAAVSPIGFPESKRSIAESFMRFSVGSSKRKPWEELFFNQSFLQPLGRNLPFEYITALEGVRLAPSSLNTQPWRIVKCKDAYHFYLMPSRTYGKNSDFKLNRIDMGIAMCHFELVLLEQGIRGYWTTENVDIEGSKEMNYTISWKEVAQ